MSFTSAALARVLYAARLMPAALRRIAAGERSRYVIFYRLSATWITNEGSVTMGDQLLTMQGRLRESDTALIEHNEISAVGEILRQDDGDARTEVCEDV